MVNPVLQKNKQNNAIVAKGKINRGAICPPTPTTIKLTPYISLQYFYINIINRKITQAV